MSRPQARPRPRVSVHGKFDLSLRVSHNRPRPRPRPRFLRLVLDVPRWIAQERVPIASNVGLRDVTWVIDGMPELLQ